MDFSELIQKALEVRGLYRKVEAERYGRSWTTGEIALGLVGDVGDLAKLVQAHAGVRGHLDESELKKHLSHELADCLWSILVLAHEMDVDVEEGFLETMEELRLRLQA